MQSTPLPPPGFPAVWRPLLERIDEALARGLAEATQREQELQAAPAPPDPDPERFAGLVEQFAPVESWLQPLRASVQRAEQVVEETSAVLKTEEEAMRAWLAAVEA